VKIFEDREKFFPVFCYNGAIGFETDYGDGK